MRVRLLGSGTSSGVPRIGPGWGDCDPDEPKNRRTRASLLVETDEVRVLVDTSPDMRAQLLDADVGRVDAVIWTHDHADHTHGIDDLRQIFHLRGSPVPGYAREATRARLVEKFGYVFLGRAGYRPTATVEPMPDELRLGDLVIRCVDQPHGNILSAGLRFEWRDIAIGYATDFHVMTPEMTQLYQKLTLWIVDALREMPHPTHPHLDQVIEWVRAFEPGHTVLMHMDHTMDYQQLRDSLPAGIEPGFDGWEAIL